MVVKPGRSIGLRFRSVLARETIAFKAIGRTIDHEPKSSQRSNTANNRTRGSLLPSANDCMTDSRLLNGDLISPCSRLP